MPITPDLPFPKSAGDAIRSKDWNDLVVETQRLDNAKVDRAGDAISGSLTVAGSLGVGTTNPRAPLHVVGAGLISDGDGSAIPNNRMRNGSLTLGSLTQSFGGGSGWNDNTAGLLMETVADTEIAVHDSGTRLASIVRYESATNSLTLGRNMGWGAINRVVINGNLGVGVDDPGHNIDVADRIRIRQGASGSAGMWLYQSTPAEDRAFVGMDGDSRVGLWGDKGAGWSLRVDVNNGSVSMGPTNTVSSQALRIDSNSKNYGIVVYNAADYALWVGGNSNTTGRAKDGKIHSSVAHTNRIDTTSTGYVNMSGMSLNISLPVAAHVLVLAQVNGVQCTGGTNKRAYFRILVNGSQVQRSTDEFNNNGWELRGIHMSEILDLPAGTHNIRLQWATSTSSTLTCCWYDDKRQLQAIELS